jgi:hypothetical protein
VKERDHLEDLNIDERIVLKRIFKRISKYGTDSSGVRWGSERRCERGYCGY